MTVERARRLTVLGLLLLAAGFAAMAIGLPQTVVALLQIPGLGVLAWGAAVLDELALAEAETDDPPPAVPIQWGAHLRAVRAGDDEESLEPWKDEVRRALELPGGR